MIIQMPRAAAASTIGINAVSSVSEPVGLHGELMMIAFVFGVIAATIFSGWTVNPSSGLVCTMTGVAFHMVSALAAAGRLGATAIGGTQAEADALLEQTRRVLDEERPLLRAHRAKLVRDALRVEDQREVHGAAELVDEPQDH